jgi:hypothetical protein
MAKKRGEDSAKSDDWGQGRRGQRAGDAEEEKSEAEGEEVRN